MKLSTSDDSEATTLLKMARKERHCKLYQQVILNLTDLSLNAFGICPKCLWDIADHENEPPCPNQVFVFLIILTDAVHLILALLFFFSD